MYRGDERSGLPGPGGMEAAQRLLALQVQFGGEVTPTEQLECLQRRVAPRDEGGAHEERTAANPDATVHIEVLTSSEPIEVEPTAPLSWSGVGTRRRAGVQRRSIRPSTKPTG